MRASLDARTIGARIALLTLDQFPDLTPPEEPGPGFGDNASEKALYYQRAAGVAVIGEDSGLVVDALGGEPGVHSARWLGAGTPYRVKNEKLLERLDGVADEARTARYVSAIAMAEEGRVVFSCQESCEGRIARAPAGEGGFGYDPVFLYPPLGRTLAELDAGEKNAVSHRGKSMNRLLDYLEARLVDDDR